MFWTQACVTLFAGVVDEKDKVKLPEDGAAFATTFLESDRMVYGNWLEKGSSMDFGQSKIHVRY